MIWAWAAAGLAAIAIAALVLSQVTIQIGFSQKGKDEDITVNAKALFGLVKLKFEIPFIRFKNLQEGFEVKAKAKQVNSTAGQLLGQAMENIGPEMLRKAYENIRKLLENTLNFNEWLRHMLGRVRCTQMDWKTTVGIGDAAETAFLAGAFWGIKTSILGLLFRYIPLEGQPRLAVVPAFNQTLIAVEVMCTFRIRMAYILLSGVQLLWRVLKVKGGLKAWRNVLLPS
ncbi:DUF2953 domain-containing protein [Paenibacillus mucilaginosus]|uniref:DUF2953 domain-containing protein n=3 Tax=Paenibacillus mucilaginosus TaxID=61624 RepID=H6NMH6_9BACL|nr:DUF2953 domain-containing protein [Paenibacillus mucilaginosus]AEI41291.1 conserved hypothetical protein [Paenibacillus mucilaginosus KNP414]AFC29842.1 hypothetical protein PM3016_2972 [Paenibacillus mucilaginosus 3016]AFH62026.1 hypothetical protein B2K_15080 [Paenibacillus mucilaginosus K02]MCG7211288.1 DUF2953 domain-containing protein [Paenibacillus mucilaginosus]WDM30322.1 DUF2953 domain-containing protein [Paenibacillus mucilaginosus]